MLYFWVWLKSWLQREKGQDLIEYALLLGLIALVCILAITLGGQAISNVWNAIQQALAGVPAP